MFGASQALILGCAEKTEKVLCQRVSPSNPIKPLHCFMGHLETETSCSFHTSQSWHLNLASPMCFGNCTLNLRVSQNPMELPDALGPVYSAVTGRHQFQLVQVLQGLFCFLRVSFQDSGPGLPSACNLRLEHPMFIYSHVTPVQLKRGGGVGSCDRADFLTGDTPGLGRRGAGHRSHLSRPWTLHSQASSLLSVPGTTLCISGVTLEPPSMSVLTQCLLCCLGPGQTKCSPEGTSAGVLGCVCFIQASSSCNTQRTAQIKKAAGPPPKKEKECRNRVCCSSPLVHQRETDSPLCILRSYCIFVPRIRQAEAI